MLGGNEFTVTDLPVLPVGATDLEVLQHLQTHYNLYIDLSPGHSLKADEVQKLNQLLGKLPRRLTRDNPLFTAIALNDSPYVLDEQVMGVHKGEQITIFAPGRDLQPGTGEYTQAAALEETLYHEIGESRWRLLNQAEQAAWEQRVQMTPVQAGLPASEQFAIAFSRFHLGLSGIPPLLADWLKVH
jgi:hypothetical protein